MNREDIIKLAREAGVNLKDDPEKASGVGNAIVSYYDLERFANLVAAAEREACAAICDRFQARDVGMQPAECAGAIRARGKI
jgi:hypothetical protein